MKVGVLDTSRGKRYVFYCPACRYDHCVDDSWGFNKDLERPTFTPSVLYREFEDHREDSKVTRVCHFYVKDGKIQYLSDCTHGLAGKTVDMEDISNRGAGKK